MYEGPIKGIDFYVENIVAHEEEGRYWSQVDHVELKRWQLELRELKKEINDLRSENMKLEHDAERDPGKFRECQS